MAFTSTQLSTEINTDPKTLGYAALVTAKNRSALVAKLNATYGGVGIVWRTDLTAREVLSCVTWSEMTTATAAQWTALSTLLIPGAIDASNAVIRALFAGLFSTGTGGINAPSTLTALTAIAKKVAPSRAEELWGYGTVVSEADVVLALGSW